MNITYKALPIKDPQIENTILSTNMWTHIDLDTFINKYKSWILDSKNAPILGLENFDYAVTDGITGAYPNFEYAYPHLETVVFQAEYPYHRDTGAKVIYHSTELQKGQKLIISLPFAAHGMVHYLYDNIIQICNNLDIPVFVDMAYFGACKFDCVNLDHPCIKFVAFSLSKAFATGRCKIGLCFYKKTKDLPMTVCNKYQYVNHVSMSIHNNLLDSFSADYIYNTYVEKQHLIAKYFNFEPSNTVFLGYNYDKSLWGSFDRNDTNNRFGIAELLVSDVNFDEVTWISKKSK
jgi:hypothetical protein